MSFLHQMRLARAPLVAFAAMGVVWGAYAALVPDTKAMLGLGDAGFGSLMLATPLAAVTAMMLAPGLAPRFGRHVLPFSVFALGLAFLSPGWLSSPLTFALAMVVAGGANGFLDVTMTARVSLLETRHGLHLMTLNHAAYSFGYAASAISTGIARDAGYGPAAVLTAAGLVVLALSLLTLEDGEGVNGFAEEGRGRVRMGMVPVWGGVMVLIAFLTENAAENWSALHIERSLGGSPAEGSFGPAVLALTMGLGRTAGQIVVARLSETHLLRWGSTIAALGMAVTALAPAPWVAWAGLVVLGLGASVIAPVAFALVGRLAPDAVRMRMIARATMLGYMGYFFGPPALGLISELFGLRMSFLSMAALILTLPLLHGFLLRAGRQADDPGAGRLFHGR